MSERTSTTELAILMTARWSINDTKPLTNSEFAELTKVLGSGQEGALALMNGEFCLATIPLETDRLQGLLNRGLGVFQAIDTWESAGVWVVSWADAGYPTRFKQLKQRAPVLLFGYGDPNAATDKALAIVGSRNASPERLSFTEEIGRACARSHVAVVSGGARGIDASAMDSTLDAQGTVVGVLADSLLKEAGRKNYRDAIGEGRLCLMSEVHPEARFDIGTAMARNRLIYACADAALIVECDPDKGGTWAGALDALKEGKTVYVIKGAKAEKELTEHGAIPIDLSFALEPEKLVRSERPVVELGHSLRVVSVVREIIGNPVRSREELLAQAANDPAALIDPLIEAALSDGIVEASANKVAKPKRKKPEAPTLFEVPGSEGEDV